MKTATGTSEERLLRRIVEGSIGAVKPANIFEGQLLVTGEKLSAFGYLISLKPGQVVKCVAIGKSAEAMAFEVKRRLGNRVNGIIATPVERHLNVEGFKFFKTGHPAPDDESLRAGKEVHDFVIAGRENDVIIFLISGGGSASIFVPVERVTLEDIGRLVKVLLDSGASIDKLNLIRRHVSTLGGGKLAALTGSRTKLSLVISDVVGDDLACIASGPTSPDTTTPADAYDFLDRSGLIGRVPKSIPDALKKLSRDFIGVKSENNTIKIIARNSDALNAAENIGIENGFNTLVLSRFLEMEAEAAAQLLVSIARSIELEGTPIPAPALVLAGGETTVKVKGRGKGGRNQHLVLSALKNMLALAKNGVVLNKTTVFSFGTDGKDGSSDAAGAYASVELAAGVEGSAGEIERHLTEYDSNSFFKKYGGLITTGPTDTNVMDILGMIIA